MNKKLFWRVISQIESRLLEIKNQYLAYFNKQRIIAISLLTKIIALSVMFPVMPIQAVEDKVEEKYQTAMIYNSDKAFPIITVIKDKPEFKSSESNYDKKLREEKERLNAEAKKARNVISRSNRVYEVQDVSLEQKRALAKCAAEAYGIDWKILESVWQVESGKKWNTSVRSYAGAQGPMQFMPGTWRAYAVDGNGDGMLDINNAEDAVYAAANLLARAGADRGDVDSALFSYNHAQWYVDKVKRVANSIIE